MKRHIPTVFAVGLGFLLANGPAFTQAGAPQDEFLPGELIVLFVDRQSTVIETTERGITSVYEPLNEVFAQYRLVSARPLFGPRSRLKNVFHLEFPPETDLDNLVALLRAMPFIEVVDKNRLMQTDLKPNDYYFNNDFRPPPDPPDGQLDQWTLYTMQFNRAWDITRGDSNVVVAIIDKGLDWLHPDLDRTVWINVEEDINGNRVFDKFPAPAGDLDGMDNDVPANGKVDDVIGWDFYYLSYDNDPYPDSLDQGNHGTFISSYVSAETNNNGYGSAGGTWFSRIMALKVGIGEERLGQEAINAAINYAIDNGAHVVNMSFSGPADSIMHLAIIEGTAVGVIFVASAGDFNSEFPNYPGSYPEAIRVAVVDSTKFKTSGSSYGTDVDICAPAAPTGDVYRGIVLPNFYPNSLYPGDQPPHVFRHNQIATSGGAAEVTAAIALLKAVYPASPSTFIKNELFRGAEPLPDPLFSQGKLGAGMVNPYRSLTQWGTVAANTTWGASGSPKTVYVSGDLTVAAGVTLTITAGTKVRVALNDNEGTGQSPTKVEFNIDGTLAILGTAPNPVVFEAWNANGTQD